ncbi:hypothetical protein [Cellulomonas sp. KRMCY2]|uniref:hypothetical protein n=1 Tax=Cellulomonas sp. KRMCY2 TaxID=1304865 RepID=UPI0012DCA48C|nr:hypothetical protein [Cellulomonas sp. KRMCY2]
MKTGHEATPVARRWALDLVATGPGRRLSLVNRCVPIGRLGQTGAIAMTHVTSLRGLSMPAAVTPMAAGVHRQHQADEGERRDGPSGHTGQPQDAGQDRDAEVQLA